MAHILILGGGAAGLGRSPSRITFGRLPRSEGSGMGTAESSAWE